MGRRKRPERVLGPYLDKRRGTWFLIHVGAGGLRTVTPCETEAEGREAAEKAGEKLQQATKRTVGDALDAYELHQRAKRLRPKTLSGNAWRLARFFPDRDLMLASVSPTWCAARYKALTAKYSVDEHRNNLNESRTFLGWCVEQGWLRANPAAGLKGIGKRRKGKAQLRMDEARTWSAKAFELAPKWPGAVAALMSLYMNMRTGEIVRAEVRDLDDGGTVLWVANSKTEAGKRVLEVPREIQPHLRRFAKGRKGGERLLGGPHDPLWVTRWVRRICALADVPVVCAQSMRGLHASIAIERGSTTHVVAKAMGHTSPRVTLAHYAKPESQRRAGQDAALKALRGGSRKRLA